MNKTELAYLPIAELRKMSTQEIRIVFTFRGHRTTGNPNGLC